MFWHSRDRWYQSESVYEWWLVCCGTWLQGLTYILLGKTGLSDALHSEITGSVTGLDLLDASSDISSEAGGQDTEEDAHIDEEAAGAGEDGPGALVNPSTNNAPIARHMNGGPGFTFSWWLTLLGYIYNISYIIECFVCTFKDLTVLWNLRLYYICAKMSREFLW